MADGMIRVSSDVTYAVNVRGPTDRTGSLKEVEDGPEITLGQPSR